MTAVSHGLCIFVMGEIVYLLIKGITSKTAKKLTIPAYAVIIVFCAVAIIMYIMDKAWMIYPDYPVEELIKIADDLMYEAKRGYYENKKI